MASKGDKEHHIIPLQIYYGVLGLLLFLTVVTVAASRVNFGAWNLLIAFGIATIKAGVVAAYFMHLKYDDWKYRTILLSSVGFVILLYVISELDIITRIVPHSTL